MNEHAPDIFEAARTGNVEALREALCDTDANTPDGRGSTPLIIAAYHDHIDAVKVLLEAKPDLDIQDGMGNTALMGVCFKGYTDIGRLLLESGAAVDVLNGNGATALTFAATFGHNDLIRLLLEHGADQFQPDRFGKSPVDYAMIQENTQGYELMANWKK